jgi:hypothetical protein
LRQKIEHGIYIVYGGAACRQRRTFMLRIIALCKRMTRGVYLYGGAVSLFCRLQHNTEICVCIRGGCICKRATVLLLSECSTGTADAVREYSSVPVWRLTNLIWKYMQSRSLFQLLVLQPRKRCIRELALRRDLLFVSLFIFGATRYYRGLIVYYSSPPVSDISYVPYKNEEITLQLSRN